MPRDGVPSLGGGGGKLTCRIDATPEGVRHALTDIRQALEPLALAPEETSLVELVLAEAMNNIVEHAYADTGTGQFDLTISLHNNGLHCELCDTGRPLPDGTPPPGARPIADEVLMTLPEGGFGWFLIRELARDLVYRCDRARNTLTFRIAVLVPLAA